MHTVDFVCSYYAHVRLLNIMKSKNKTWTLKCLRKLNDAKDDNKIIIR